MLLLAHHLKKDHPNSIIVCLISMFHLIKKLTAKFRNIFTDLILKHTTAKESHDQWLEASNMKYWPQQVSFAYWCATAACGVGYDMLTEYNPMMTSLIKFHILFTTRRVPLPGDKHFNNLENNYKVNGYNKICREFGISTNTDFRYNTGDNHGLNNKNIFGEILVAKENYDQTNSGWDIKIFR